MGIETICEGGYGGKAKVFVQLRNIFPGLGGTVRTKQDFAIACRVPKGMDASEFESDLELTLDDPRALEALRTDLRHMLIKKLDDYFFRSGTYRFAHVPRPLGTTSTGGNLYEWVHGTEGFYEFYHDGDIWQPVEVDEWRTVSNAFNGAGVNIFHDISDNDALNWTKNIIVQEQGIPTMPE